MKPGKPLRALRLWHWREALQHRKYEQSVLFPGSVNHHKSRADFHIRAVQTLNEFFKPGDTAEKDDET